MISWGPFKNRENRHVKICVSATLKFQHDFGVYTRWLCSLLGDPKILTTVKDKSALGSQGRAVTQAIAAGE